MRRQPAGISMLTGFVLLVAGCVGLGPMRARSSALDFLYPKGQTAAQPAADVRLELPLRVGLAFAPVAGGWDAVSPTQKETLLTSVADAFRSRTELGRLEVVPSHYLQPGGGFENLDRLAAQFGLDLMVLVSYDQVRFTESTRASWTYLTVVGALVVNGEKNEVRTVMDAVVYDIPSRAMLFRAAGESSLGTRSNPFTQDRKTRSLSEAGFEEATTSLIANLGKALDAFEEQAKSGTVRGPGTPAVAVVDTRAEGAGGGAGGFAGVEGIAILLLAAGALLARTTRPA